MQNSDTHLNKEQNTHLNKEQNRGENYYPTYLTNNKL